MKKSNRILSLALVLLLMVTLVGPTITIAEETTIDLRTANNFAVLAGSTITNIGITTIDGDVGLHPGTVFSGQNTATISGAVHLADAVALQGKTDLLAAFNNAAARTSNTTNSELGGSTLTPGVYSSATSFQITGTLTLDGQNNPDAVFIFQTGSTFTTASSSKIELINGANYKNVFWQVGSSATLGTNSEFKGTILSSESITATTGATIKGKLLTLGGAVTLDSNTIINTPTTSLTVLKIVNGDTIGLSLPTFEISVTGPENFSINKNFVHNESFTWDNLVPGTYNITENRTGLNEEWTVSGEGAVEVLAEQGNLATITNAYLLASETTSTPKLKGSLTVEKNVTGDLTNLILPTFEFTITGPNGFTDTRNIESDSSYTWDNLVPGNYNVTENPRNLTNQWAVSGEGEVQVVADQTARTIITNHFEVTEAIVTEPEEPIVVDTIPQTGQSTNYTTAMLLGIAAILLAITSVFSAKKRNHFSE